MAIFLSEDLHPRIKELGLVGTVEVGSTGIMNANIHSRAVNRQEQI
jgi:hypothetical protein